MNASILLCLLVWAPCLFCQGGLTPVDDLLNLPYSPEVRADRHVTFRLYAPNAKEVVLVGIDRRRLLTKGGQGVWSITVGPLKPAIYSYSFAVDGAVRIPDPANPNVETRRWGHISYVAVAGDGSTAWEYRSVPHGTLHTHRYESQSLEMSRHFIVYTPPGYERSRRRYPVLVLLHGLTHLEESWSRVGGAQNIMDNLLADRKIVPMIVVMPFGHVVRQMTPQTSAASRGELQRIENDLLTGVLPEVERLYRVSAGKANRAIAGLSMGGGQAVAIALHHPDAFAYVGSFSGTTVYRSELEKSDPKVLNRSFKLIWIGCGTEDSSLEVLRSVAAWLEKNGVSHVWRETPGAHVWPVWRDHLVEMAPLLFRTDKAAR